MVDTVNRGLGTYFLVLSGSFKAFGQVPVVCSCTTFRYSDVTKIYIVHEVYFAF